MTSSISRKRTSQLHIKSSSGATSVSKIEASKVAEYLASYVPRSVSPELWASGLDLFVRTQLTQLDLTMALANRLVWTLSIHGAFCMGEGIWLDVESVLDPDAVERFCEWANGRYSPSSAATMRSRLRTMGRLLTRKAPWEPLPEAVARKALTAPYSSREISLILRDISHQATSARNRAATATTLLGLGAGLDARWIPKIRGTDVRRYGEHVVVDVPAPSARVVAVRSAFTEQLLELAQQAGDEQLVSASGANSKNAVSNICAKVSIDRGLIHLNAARLRSSWLVAHLSAGTPMPALIEAAGTKGFGSFDDLLPFVERKGEQDERNALASA